MSAFRPGGRMSRPSIFNSCRQCLQNQRLQTYRPFSTTRLVSASRPPIRKLENPSQETIGNSKVEALRGLFKHSGNEQSNTALLGLDSMFKPKPKPEWHHFHVYSTKHNTHITFTGPNRAPIISLSAGNLSFRKAARGSYDAAYQLAAYVLAQIMERGLMANIQQVEVILRGFGQGRDAVTKAILGNEGRMLRPKISKVSDATRLKFGGTRSPKPRRLG